MLIRFIVTIFFALLFNLNQAFSYSVEQNIQELFNANNAKIDLNEDGVIDYEIKSYFDGQIKTLVWHQDNGRIEIDKGEAFSQRRIYQNNTLVETQNYEGISDGIFTRLYQYRDSIPTLKETTVVYPKKQVKEILQYAWKDKSWTLVKTESFEIETHLGELNSNNLSNDWCSEFFEGGQYGTAPFPNYRPRIRVLEDEYLYSKMGFKIDLSTCAEDAIEEIGEAIQEMRTQYIPCLQGYRPMLAALLLMDLWQYESVIHCRPVKDGVAADTKTHVGAAINVYGIRASGSFSSSNLGNTLMHEVLHHHLDSCKHHSQDLEEDDSIEDKTIRYDDGVYGCTEMCEYDMKQTQNRLTEKGCQRCLGDKFDSTHTWDNWFNQDNLSRKEAAKKCLEHPRIRRIKLCEKYEGKKDCSKHQLDAFEHEDYGQCLQFYARHNVDEDDCDSITEIEKTLSPRFDQCFVKFRALGFKGSDCMSSFIEIFDDERFDECLNNYGQDHYSCRSGYLLNKPIHEDCKNLITPSERRECMREKYAVPYQSTPHHYLPFGPGIHHGFGVDDKFDIFGSGSDDFMF